MLHRPAARGVRRRPAAPKAAVAPRRGGREDQRTEDEKYRAGEEVNPFKVSPGVIGRGDWLHIGGVYYQQNVELAAKVQKEEIEAGERELVLELTGTSSEEVLRFWSGVRPPLAQLHLCGPDCLQRRENPNLVHGMKIRKLPADGAVTWEKNLIMEDEIAGIRDDREEWERRQKEAADKKEAKSSSSSRDKKKKKKKKRKKEKKKGEGDKPSPERKKKKMGGKTIARKERSALYSGTGLDPVLKDRKRLIRKTKKALKRTSATSSSGTSSTSSTASMEEDTGEILQDRSKVHRIAMMAPGVLSASAIETIRTYLTQVSGTGWEEENETLPPLLCLYHRTYLMDKITGGVGREFATLSYVGDLLLQARPAEALDVVVQRLKALEMSASGTSWMTSQKLELVPPTVPSIGTRQEYQVAQRETKLDNTLKGSSTSEKGKGKAREKGKEQPKGKSKGKQKDGEGKKQASGGQS